MFYYLTSPLSIVSLLLLLIHSTLSLFSNQSLTVPLQLHHKVPYVHLSSFCQHRPTDAIGFQDAVVLLDSGSDQFWLADHQCSQCSYTQSLCPQISSSDQMIGYYSGNIHGSYSFVKVCEKRQKFLCVRGASQMNNLAGQGILGLRKKQQKSVGYSMFFSQNQEIQEIQNEKSNKLIVKDKILVKSATFYYGLFENYLLLNSSEKYAFSSQDSSQSIKIDCKGDWSTIATKIGLLGSKQQVINEDKSSFSLINDKNTINKDSLIISFDTGSSQLVFPMSICTNIIQILQSSHSISCGYIESERTGTGIYCNTKIDHISIVFQTQLGSVFQFGGQFMIQTELNKIDVICLQKKKEKQKDNTQNDKKIVNMDKIVLGYPFFKTHRVTLTSVTDRQTKNNTNYVFLGKYDELLQEKQRKNVKICVFVYCMVMVFLGWGTLCLLHYLQDKRDKKIII